MKTLRNFAFALVFLGCIAGVLLAQDYKFGNISATQYTAAGSGAGAFICTQGSAQGHATANTATVECPAAVTAYEILLPSAAATGLLSLSNSSSVMTGSIVVPAFSTQTDGATVTWALGSAFIANATLTFTTHGGSRTLNITNPINGGSYVLKVIQDGTGGEGLTLGTGCTWKVSGGGAGAITPSVTASAQDVLAFTFDGTNCYANFNKNFN